MPRRAWPLSLSALLLAVLALGGGCRCSRTPPPTSARGPEPSVRLYLVSTVAGALEPCGCVKDMLGGVDHFAALVASEAGAAPRRAVLGAGPMLFADPVLDPKKQTQDEWKAKALFDVLSGAGLLAWAPAANDFAAGTPWLAEVAGQRGALLAANLEGKGGFQPVRVVELGGERVGIAGVSAPRFSGPPPSDVEVGDAGQALERALKSLTEQGARVKVALAAMPRGDALRLAEKLPGFQVMLIGKPVDRGDTNDPPTPPVLVGETLVVEAPYHLQAVAVVDLFVREGRYSFADGSGIANEERRTSLKLRIDELEARLASARSESVDILARRRELERLKGELVEASRPPPEPATSFFRYRYLEIREKLGSAPPAAARLAEYFKRVNEHNREAFKDLLPAPAPVGTSSYVGVEQCTRCHQSQRAFWNGTQHATAYATLSRQDKQFNLECVGCHVTGYEAPGGSTVTHVDRLENVQCENCHGPGSRHAANPNAASLIAKAPDRALCAAKCHHPPHVKASWSVDEAWKLIVGKGHGG